jgi:hypothetical protein
VLLSLAIKVRRESEKSLEWNRETEFFILCFYIVIPTLVIGAVIMGLILLLRSLIRARNSWRKRK